MPIRAADTPKPPDRREIYIPANDLAAVLAEHPRAVMLTREQYETLLRDAKKTLAPAPKPPMRAVLSDARYNARLSDDLADVQAEFTVDVLSDEWAEVPLRLGELWLGNIKLDAQTAVENSQNDTRLLIRGRGRHKITASFMLRVQRDSGINSLRFSLPQAAAGLFTINLPPEIQVECPLPVEVKKTQDTTVASIALGAQDNALISWHASGDSHQSSSMVFQENSFIYTIDETKVQSDLGIVLNAALGRLPSSVKIRIPVGSTPLHVNGNEVLKWSVAGESMTIDFTPGDRKTAGFRLLLESASLDSEKQKTFPLPLPEIEGIRRSSGRVAVVGSSGVKVREIFTGSGAIQSEGLFAGNIENDPHFISAYGFAVQPETIKVAVEKVTPRFNADLDTLVEFSRDAVSIERTLSLSGVDGEIFETGLLMPKGEKLISIRDENNGEPEWKATGTDIKIRWNRGLENGGRLVFKIKSEVEPPKWPETDSFSPEDLEVTGAAKTNGYLAIKADEMFRLETGATEGLEPRDGRSTPVRGDFAWFRRDSFKLAVKISRRTPEIQATLLACALPVEGALDVHGQLNYNVLYSGVKKLRIKVPSHSAAEFYFDGSQIAERNRDGDIWTIVFQKEIRGAYPLKFHAMIPFDAKESNFHAEAPVVEALDARQQSGTWAIEANTSTEITFKTTGLNELDPLRAPVLADYQPQHHIIGVFGYMGAYSLKMEGVKHDTAPILTTVADRLELDTVIATSGAERHQAQLFVRSAGDQYLDVTLPESSQLWSLTVDDQPLKPVAEKTNVVRVQLPATLDRSTATRIRLLYETRRHEWGTAGGYRLAAPRLDAHIPVLECKWHVYLPDGFSYSAFDGNLRETKTANPEPLVFLAWDWLKELNPFCGKMEFATLSGKLVSTARPKNGYEEQSRCLSDEQVITEKLHVKRELNQLEANKESLNETHVQLPVAARNMPASKPGISPSATPDFEKSKADESLKSRLANIIIPKIEFHEATVSEAIDFLNQKCRELDPEHQGVRIKIQGINSSQTGGNSSDQKITLSLSNCPLMEAMHYITSLANLKIKIEGDQVSIVPISECTDTLISSLNDIAQTAVSDDKFFAPAPLPKKKAGLLPMKLDLERSGQEFSFEGLCAPGSLNFHYIDWWNQSRHGWFWWTVGGLAFAAVSRCRANNASAAGRRCYYGASRKFLWGTLLLTAVPLCFAQSLTGFCNTLLVGWLTGFLMIQIAKRLVFRRRVMMEANV